MSHKNGWTDSPNPKWEMGQKLSENETSDGKEWYKAVNENGFKALNPDEIEPGYSPSVHER